MLQSLQFRGAQFGRNAHCDGAVSGTTRSPGGAACAPGWGRSLAGEREGGEEEEEQEHAEAAEEGAQGGGSPGEGAAGAGGGRRGSRKRTATDFLKPSDSKKQQRR